MEPQLNAGRPVVDTDMTCKVVMQAEHTGDVLHSESNTRRVRYFTIQRPRGGINTGKGAVRFDVVPTRHDTDSTDSRDRTMTSVRNGMVEMVQWPRLVLVPLSSKLPANTAGVHKVVCVIWSPDKQMADLL